jgi:hypothetical protein
MSTKTPVCWNAQCFVHVRSDDRQDFYHLDPGGPELGYLTHERTGGAWLASLRGAKAVALPEQHGAFEGEADVARRALNDALAKLRVRVESDRKWLAMIDEEIG